MHAQGIRRSYPAARSRLALTTSTPPRVLTAASLRDAARELAERDSDLATVIDMYGVPPLWARRPGFATLVRIILEQQVSLASAAATYGRLRQSVDLVTADRVAALSPARLRSIGLTHQKASYCLGLARLITSGQLNLHRISRLGDADARSALLAVRGIGPWTADIYQLMALRRPDVWPDGDLALREAARQLKRLRERPTDDQLREVASAWRPWRSVAARILWHHYLSTS